MPPSSDEELAPERRGSVQRARLHRNPKTLATSFSKKVLNWLYSFSLVILMILTFVIVFITPVDVVLQTWGANFTGVKLFIIIASISLFLLASLTFYFSRLIKTRVKVNQIPAKSVYLPLEKNDLSEDLRRHILANLNRCLGEIRAKAGPLQNEDEPFDYPGMSPPLYIQQRNMELGLHIDSGLPPNCIYQDLINSIGLKLKVDGLLAGTVSYPTHYTFREIIYAIAEQLEEAGAFTPDLARATRQMVDRYEKFRFSGQLIEQQELISFFVEFERVMLCFVNSQSLAPVGADPHFRSSLSVFASSFDNTSQYDVEQYPDIRMDPGFLDPYQYRGKPPQRRFSEASDGTVSRISTSSSRRTSFSRQLTRSGSVIKSHLGARTNSRGSAGRTLSFDD